MYNELASGYGVGMATGYVLLSIDRKGTPSTALGPKMGMEATSLSRVLKGMEEKGLIERKPNPDDGRSVLVYLTDFGKEKRKDAKRTVINFNQALFDYFEKEKVDSFFEVLGGIHDLISTKDQKIYDNQKA